MNSSRSLLLIGIVVTLCAIYSAIVQGSFTPPTPDGQCFDTFDPDSVDETTWNEYAPVACEPSTARLFSDTGPNDIFELELQADFDVINDLSISLVNQSQATSPGTLRYRDAVTNETIAIPITLEARGKSRFSSCAFRPLKIVFDSPQTGNMFEGVSTKLKVVTHCGNHPTSSWILGGTPEEQRRRLLAEYYFYEVLETLGSTALSTRLARITYRDDDGSVIVTEYAILREREDNACQRCGFVDEANQSDVLTPDATSVFQKHLYNKFVYNNDYSVDQDDGSHNTRRCKDASLNGFYIPYDWDLTGVIRPDYSRNFNINYEDNATTFWNWLDTAVPEVRTKVQAWHIVDHDEDMWQVLQSTWMDDEGEALMQGWYGLYMCVQRCYLGIGGTINIVEPTASFPAATQPTDGSGRLLIRVDYQPLSIIPNADDFEVRIGGVSSPVIGGAQVGSQYWLVVQTPAGITGASTLQVSCRLCAMVVEDSEVGAVPFGDPSSSDTVLVIDTSGSMNDDRKLESAKNAAALFINTLRDGEGIGVVEYSGELASGYGKSDEVFNIRRVDVEDGRAAAEAKVLDLSAGDTTPLGEGLLRGLEELDQVVAAQRNDVRSLILLSDGKENVPNYWAEPPVGHYSPPEPPNTPVVSAFTAAPNDEIRIHTVSLGPDADPDLMADIASGRGSYRHADVISTASGSGMGSLDFPTLIPTAYAGADMSALELPLRLSNLYEHLHNETSAQQRLLQIVHTTTRTKDNIADFAGTSDTAAATTSSGGNLIQFLLEPGLSYATISVSWTNSARKSLQVLAPAGQDPAGISITRSNTNTVFRIEQPKDGVWKIAGFGRTAGEKFFITVSGISVEKGIARAVVPSDKYSAESRRVQGVGSLDPGEAIPLVLALTGERPITNATVSALVRSSANGWELVQLNDAADHGDTKAGDGFYTGAVMQTAQGGAFYIEIKAAWAGVDGVRRTRTFPLSVSMKELDSDGDSISDQDETRIGLDPKNPQDAGADSDRDGLPNWKELLFELDPFNPDTDGGGASDGVEVASGGNPLNPDDDKDIKEDGDGDGLSDVWEVAFGLDPNDPTDADKDSDSDGLTNVEEFGHGTSPIDSDTDGDQASDGDELESGTDPTDRENRSQLPTDQDDVETPYILWLLLLIIILLAIIVTIMIYLSKRKKS